MWSLVADWSEADCLINQTSSSECLTLGNNSLHLIMILIRDAEACQQSIQEELQHPAALLLDVHRQERDQHPKVGGSVSLKADPAFNQYSICASECLTLPEPSDKQPPTFFLSLILPCNVNFTYHTHHATTSATSPARLRHSNTYRHEWQPNYHRYQCRSQHTERHSPPTGRATGTSRNQMGRGCSRQRRHGQEEQQSVLHLPQTARTWRVRLRFFELLE